MKNNLKSFCLLLLLSLTMSGCQHIGRVCTKICHDNNCAEICVEPKQQNNKENDKTNE